MSGVTYEIRTVADFCKVPRERRAVCLEEFELCLAYAEAMTVLIDAVHAEVAATDADAPAEPPLHWPLRAFRWTDDDKPGLTGVSIEFGASPGSPVAPPEERKA